MSLAPGACMNCGGRLTVGPSCFPEFDLLACPECGRSVRVIVKNQRRPAGAKPIRRADRNRMLRAIRRVEQRKPR